MLLRAVHAFPVRCDADTCYSLHAYCFEWTSECMLAHFASVRLLTSDLFPFPHHFTASSRLDDHKEEEDLCKIWLDLEEKMVERCSRSNR